MSALHDVVGKSRERSAAIMWGPSTAYVHTYVNTCRSCIRTAATHQAVSLKVTCARHHISATFKDAMFHLLGYLLHMQCQEKNLPETSTTTKKLTPLPIYISFPLTRAQSYARTKYATPNMLRVIIFVDGG